MKKSCKQFIPVQYNPGNVVMVGYAGVACDDTKHFFPHIQ
jgi:hypothetical protein